jgi:Zn-dependent protease
MLACPACARLVHSEELARLAAEAERAERDGDPEAAIAAWRRTLALLPGTAGQRARIGERIERLVGAPRAARTPGTAPATVATAAAPSTAAAPAPTAAPPPLPKPEHVHPASAKKRGAVATAALFALAVLSKAKLVLVFALTKAKLLLFGLTKITTLGTMAASLGVYWAAWGWWFAAGLVGSIYVHEIGHVAEMRRRGMKATAPMFIPGFGALVRLNERPASPTEDARIGLAGPIWGATLAVLLAVTGLVTGNAYACALARMGALLNLFNLLPVWQLDGARGFVAMSRLERGACALALLGAYAWTRDGIVLLVAIVAAIRVAGRTPGPGDRIALAQFAGIVAVLAAVLALVPAAAP